MANENGEISPPPPKKRGQPINDNNIYLLIEDVNLPSSNQSNCAKKVNCYLNERTKRSRFQRLYQHQSLFEEKQRISVVLGPHRMSSLQVFVPRYRCSFRFIAGYFLM